MQDPKDSLLQLMLCSLLESWGAIVEFCQGYEDLWNMPVGKPPIVILGQEGLRGRKCYSLHLDNLSDGWTQRQGGWASVLLSVISHLMWVALWRKHTLV